VPTPAKPASAARREPRASKPGWPRLESNQRSQIRSLPLYPLSYGAEFDQSSAVETDAAARAWIEGWSRAWPAADADAVAALYAEDASFRSQPFREPQDPRAYAEWAFSQQDEAECWFGEPIVTGNRAIVEYWAVVRYQGKDETIAGIAVIRFRPDGLVAEQHDYWNAQEGRVEPP
jgi:ketosteroid isomerase-like protein